MASTLPLGPMLLGSALGVWDACSDKTCFWGGPRWGRRVHEILLEQFEEAQCYAS